MAFGTIRFTHPGWSPWAETTGESVIDRPEDWQAPVGAIVVETVLQIHWAERGRCSERRAPTGALGLRPSLTDSPAPHSGPSAHARLGE